MQMTGVVVIGGRLNRREVGVVIRMLASVEDIDEKVLSKVRRPC
jgi:hypothetical protein